MKIYRKLSIELSKVESAKFLQDLALSGGSIVSSFTLFYNSNVTRYHGSDFERARIFLGSTTIWFNLVFLKQSHLDDFHKLGNETEQAETYENLRLNSGSD